MNKENVLNSFFRKYKDRFHVYPHSIKQRENSFFFMIKDERCKYLLVAGIPQICNQFDGQPLGNLECNKQSLQLKIAPLNHHNLITLQRFFPSLAPSVGSKSSSFGTGDRLGITTPAHIRAFEGKDIFPVLAQQSIRENERTGRSLQDVLDDAIWGCFEAGYSGPFGADADHVKRIENLKEAVDCGYTMFTVDPSDFVRGNIGQLSEDEKNSLYQIFPEREKMEKRYSEKTYRIGEKELHFGREKLRDIILTYFNALEHVVRCYRALTDYKNGDFDFEVSVDETELPTSPLAHIFISEELHRQGVDFQNLALHFVGDWQKGIDYIGDVDEFNNEIFLHASIAKKFGGYKLSLHSGSDKFSAYPAFSERTEGFFHVKTAGTSYLEAIRVIARKNSSLYREIHRFALSRFEEDRASYHVTTDLNRIPDLDEIPDDKLDGFLEKPDSRQLLHITFGSVLTAKNEQGEFVFRDRIYRTLFEHEEDYYGEVTRHIGKHLELLSS